MGYTSILHHYNNPLLAFSVITFDINRLQANIIHQNEAVWKFQNENTNTWFLRHFICLCDADSLNAKKGILCFLKGEYFLNGKRFLHETLCTLTKLLLFSDILLGFYLDFSCLEKSVCTCLPFYWPIYCAPGLMHCLCCVYLFWEK